MIAGTMMLSYEDPNGNVWVLLVRDSPIKRGPRSFVGAPLARWADSDTPFIFKKKYFHFKFPGGRINDGENEHFRQLTQNQQLANLVQWANSPEKQTNLSGALRELKEETQLTIGIIPVGEGTFLKYQTKEVVPDTDNPNTDVVLHVFHWHLGRINQSQINALHNATRVGDDDVCAAIWYPVSCIYLYDMRVEKTYSLIPNEGLAYRTSPTITGLQHAYYSNECILSQTDRYFSIDPMNAKWLEQAKMLASCKPILPSDVLHEKQFERFVEKNQNIINEYEEQHSLHVTTGNQYILRFPIISPTTNKDHLRKFVRNQYLAAALFRLHGVHDLPSFKLVLTQEGYIIATPHGRATSLNITRLTDQQLIGLIAGLSPDNLRRATDEARRKCILDCIIGDDTEKEKLATDLNQRIADVIPRLAQLENSSSLPVSRPQLLPVSQAPVKKRIVIEDKKRFIHDLIGRESRLQIAFKSAAGRYVTFEERYQVYSQLYKAILMLNPQLFQQRSDAQYVADLKWCQSTIDAANLMREKILNSLQNYLKEQKALISGTYKPYESNFEYNLETCPLRSLYGVYKKEVFIYFLQNLSADEKREYALILEELLILLSKQYKQIREDYDWFRRQKDSESQSPGASKNFDLSEDELRTKYLVMGRLINFLNLQGSLLAGTHVTEQGKVIDVQRCSTEYLLGLFSKADIVRQLRALSPELLKRYAQLNGTILSRVDSLFSSLDNAKIFANEINLCVDDGYNITSIIEMLRPTIDEIRSSSNSEDAELRGKLEVYYLKPEPMPVPTPTPKLPVIVEEEKEHPYHSDYIDQVFSPQLPGLVFEKLSRGQNTLLKAVSIFLDEKEIVLREKAIAYLTTFKTGVVAADGSSTDEYREKIQHGQDITVEILSSALGRSIIIIDENGKAGNFTSSNEIHGAPIFVYSNDRQQYDAFVCKENYNPPQALKELFPDTPAPLVPPRDNVPVIVVPAPPVPAPKSNKPPAVAVPVSPLKPPPALPKVSSPTPVIHTPMPLADLVKQKKEEMDAKKESKHIILPLDIGTDKKPHWVLLQFVAAPINKSEKNDLKADIARVMTGKRVAFEDDFDLDNYDSTQVNFLLSAYFKVFEKKVLLLDARSKEDFLKISSSKDLLQSNSDEHSHSQLSFTYFDPCNNQIDSRIKAHLQKLSIGVECSKLNMPADNENTGLWIIEAAKALVHGSGKLEGSVKEINSSNFARLNKAGLVKLPEEDDTVLSSYTPAFHKPPAPVAKVKAPAAAGAPVAKQEVKLVP